MPDKSTKKILFIITKSVWGGAQKYVFDLAANLPKDQFEPVIAGGGKGIRAEKIITAGMLYLEIKSFQRDIKFWKEIVSFFEILKILFKTKPDIVHVSNSKAGGVAGLANFIYSAAKKITKPFLLLGHKGESYEKALLSSDNYLAVKPPRGGLTAHFPPPRRGLFGKPARKGKIFFKLKKKKKKKKKKKTPRRREN